jgi:hypothetical protein
MITEGKKLGGPSYSEARAPLNEFPKARIAPVRTLNLIEESALLRIV